MRVENLKGICGAHCIPSDVPAQQNVSWLDVIFRVDIEYHDHPYIDNGKGRFKVWLEVMTNSGWTQVDYNEKDLGNGDYDGDWYDILDVSFTITEPFQVFRVRMECRIKEVTIYTTSFEKSCVFTCVQEIGQIGDFTLDFIPLSIVYCPPGQDMTNSLSQTMEFGTQITVGSIRSMQATKGVHAGANLLGIFSEEASKQESQNATNTATNSLAISHFRNTVVTADNQRAIGRAYWGPLGDIFVVMVNPRFSGSQRADGTIFYEHKDCDQIVLIPAHKLLRPGDDPIANNIPKDVRRRLLELDPFITNLDYYFSDPVDETFPILNAANPYADPSEDGRAEAIGMWHLSNGLELNYSIGETLELHQKSAKEIEWTSTMSGSAAVVIGGSASFTTQVGVQWSKEASVGFAKTASCFLIRNQNNADLEGLKLYYDKNFSTIMFRKIRSASITVVPEESLQYIVELFQDVRLTIIEEVLRELAASLGVDPLVKHGELDWKKQDLNIEKCFPDVPQEKLPNLYKSLRHQMQPNKVLKGTVYGKDKTPIVFEDIYLYIGKTLYAQSQTDGAGQYRFDNILPGKNYKLSVGVVTKNVSISAKNTALAPKNLTITNAKTVIDRSNISCMKLRRVLAIAPEKFDLVVQNIGQLDSIEKYVRHAKLGPSEKDALKNSVVWR